MGVGAIGFNRLVEFDVLPLQLCPPFEPLDSTQLLGVFAGGLGVNLGAEFE
jgi:hypothetical protein